MRRNRQTSVGLGLIAILGLTAAACGGDDDAAGGSSGGETATFESPQEGVSRDRVDVGVIYDQTGATASTQTVFFAGIESYVERINREGGVNGRQINLLEEDEKYDVPTAVAAYNKLVNQTPTVALMALNNSSFQGAVIGDVAEDEIPIVGAESTTQAAVNPFNPWFFALQCTYTDQADVAVAYLINKTGIDEPTAVALYGDVASGQEWSGLIEERIDAAGGEFLGGISITYGSTEADAQAQQIASLDPDMIFLHGGTSIGVPALTSLEKFGVTDTPIAGIFALETVPVAEASEAVGANFSAINCYSAANQPGIAGAEQLIADAEANGVSEDVYTATDFANGYVSAMVLVEGLERAGDELTRASLADALETIEDLETEGLSPNVTFGPDDRIGIASVRPYEFDYDQGIYVPVGEYEDFSDCITNQYVTESIDTWDPTCASEVASS
ncbi:MAG: ABC transporter substrate-binding protein [Acidimicrobiales bacterium]